MALSAAFTSLGSLPGPSRALAPRPFAVRGGPLRASASDRLLYDSLSREVSKLKSGKTRAADRQPRPAARPGPRPSRPPVRYVERRAPSSWSSSSAPVAARLFGVLCFLGPLVLSIPYGMQLFASSSFLREMLLKPLLPLVLAFHSSKFANLLSIVALYALARNKSLHPFTRTISRQASTLMMVQFPANFILQFFGAPGPISNLLRGSVFVYFLYCVFFGRVADLPAIGAGAPTFPRSGSMFRGGLRGGFRGSN
ncbi:unnamed protein product [Durusdinium trenchii]|uniref:Protein TIC 20 n=1 Tax=Durusdinium trenchii TaxID=1381693 RepID=A0ABP0HBN2_9DINO